MVYQISLFQGILSIQPWMSANQRLLGNKPSTPSLLFLGNCLSTFQKKGPQDQPIYLLFPYPTQHQIHPHAPRFWRSHSMNNTRVFLFPLFFSIFSSSRHDNCVFHRDAEMTLQILFLLQPPTWTHTHCFPLRKSPKQKVLFISQNDSYTALHIIQAPHPLPWLKSIFPLWAHSPSPLLREFHMPIISISISHVDFHIFPCGI